MLHDRAMETGTWQCPQCRRSVAKRLKQCPRCAGASDAQRPSLAPGGPRVRLLTVEHVAGMTPTFLGTALTATAQRVCDAELLDSAASEGTSPLARTIDAARHDAELELCTMIAGAEAEFGLGFRIDTTPVVRADGSLLVAVTAYATPARLVTHAASAPSGNSGPQIGFGVGISYVEFQ